MIDLASRQLIGWSMRDRHDEPEVECTANMLVRWGKWGQQVSNLRPLACKTADPQRHAHQGRRRSCVSGIRTVICCLYRPRTPQTARAIGECGAPTCRRPAPAIHRARRLRPWVVLDLNERRAVAAHRLPRSPPPAWRPSRHRKVTSYWTTPPVRACQRRLSPEQPGCSAVQGPGTSCAQPPCSDQ